MTLLAYVLAIVVWFVASLVAKAALSLLLLPVHAAICRPIPGGEPSFMAEDVMEAVTMAGSQIVGVLTAWAVFSALTEADAVWLLIPFAALGSFLFIPFQMLRAMEALDKRGAQHALVSGEIGFVAGLAAGAVLFLR